MPGPSLRRFLHSVPHALRGLRRFFRTERNGQIEGIVTVLVLSAGFFFRIRPIEWVCVVGCCALVLCLEIVNSAIEQLCNHVTPELHPAIRIIKDFAAAAVLLASLAAAVAGGIIFLPYLLSLFQ